MKNRSLTVIAITSATNLFLAPRIATAQGATVPSPQQENKTPSKDKGAIQSAASGSNKAEKDLPSPYFVVGFLCEGMPTSSPGTNLLLGKEFAERVFKENVSMACEKNFEALGIEKYSWVSGQDLERVDFLLNRKNSFQKHRIEIRPAEAPGQVYLKLILDPKGSNKLIGSLEAEIGLSSAVAQPTKVEGFVLSGQVAQQTSTLGPFQTTTAGLNFSVAGPRRTQHPRDYSVSLWAASETQLTKDWRGLSRFSLNGAKVRGASDVYFFGSVAYMRNLFRAANLMKAEFGPALGYYGGKYMGGAQYLMTMEADPLSHYLFKTEYLTSAKGSKRVAVDFDYQNRLFGSDHFYYGAGLAFVSTDANIWNAPHSGQETQIAFYDDTPDVSNGLRVGYAFATGEDLHQIALRLKGIGASESSGTSEMFYSIALDYTKKTEDLDLKLGIVFQNSGSNNIRLPM